MGQVNDGYRFKSGLTLKNRMLLAPMTTDNGTAAGGLSREDLEFLVKRSAGFGAIIIGSHSVSGTGNAFEKGWNLHNPANHAALKTLVSRVHQGDTKVILQIYHAGRMAQPAFIDNQQPIAPSRVPALRPFASYPKEMSETEIQETIQAFQEATSIALCLGFDGVELHGANTYLLQQFFSPHSNRRTDSWGGSLEKRMRFPMAVVLACQQVIQAEADRPFLLGYRFSPEEMETPGIRLQDTCQLLRAISQQPLDYLHLSLSNYQKISRDGKDILEVCLEAVGPKVPVIASGAIQAARDVEAVLAKVPLFSVGKASVIDPLWAQKISAGKEDVLSFLRMGDRERLAIPRSLWHSIKGLPSYFAPTREEWDE